MTDRAESIGIAEARARLPELAGRVAARPGDVVVIENRRRGERVVLTAESYLNTLEAVVAAAQRQGGEPFELEGSIVSHLDADELDAAMAALRAARDAADLARLEDLLPG